MTSNQVGFMHRPVWKVSYTTGQTAEEHAFGSVPRGHDIESGRLHAPPCLESQLYHGPNS